ncbi:MAG: MBL fold metallo-hydrolase [bacterium]|nr:MBL fold metallo-hydrolase [bacterium]
MRNATSILLLCLLPFACGGDSRMVPTDATDGSKQDPQPAQARPGFDATYIANAGFLMTGPEGVVLFDSLYTTPSTEWRAPTPQTLDALTMPRKPFDQVTVVVVTHNHPDHYDADTVATHMRNNTKAHLITTAQIGEDMALNIADFASFADRVHAQTPNPNESIELEVAGIAFKLMLFTHGKKSTSENLGVQFTLGGVKILHVGDSQALSEDIAAYALPGEGIDVAFFPFWMLMREWWQTTIREAIAPGTIVAMHLNPRTVVQKHIQDRGGWDAVFASWQEQFPTCVIIEEPASSVHFD